MSELMSGIRAGILQTESLEPPPLPLSLLPFPPPQHPRPAPELGHCSCQCQWLHLVCQQTKWYSEYFNGFPLGLNECLKPENKRLILSSAHIIKTKSALMQSLPFSKHQSGFWEVSCHFEEWAIRTLLIREIRLIGLECDGRVCPLMKMAVQSGCTPHSPRALCNRGRSGSQLKLSVPWPCPDLHSQNHWCRGQTVGS